MAYISPTKALQHVDRLALWKQGRKASPVTIEWDLSNRCYLGCEACLTSDAMIETMAGPVPITQVSPGDIVLAYQTGLFDT